MFRVRFVVSRKGDPHLKSTGTKRGTPRTLSDTHLEFHLLGLLGVDSHNVLVMPECVSAVLLLCGHVSLQSLQHALRLEGKVVERTESVR